ncbi:recombinase RecQ [Rhodoferax koreense]|uniref:ATP-dependent DNA helicase RecQ n=1 Tax=Rhodoferax koreensis TaxID=1842727 RepID=A0A1P8K3K8_9BURK|nr:recombinase RecQ [Rhodoferax koreense]
MGGKPSTLERKASATPAQRDRRIRDALRRGFGLQRMRTGQREVIERVLDGRHTLAVMPTGAGKSLCYQLPALLLPGKTVVVSPLIALMKDQCETLCERGIQAVQVNSAIDAETLHAAERAIADGTARIVLTTPERLADAAFMALLQRQPTSLLAVDEAHCISQWGHDFRPAFLDIAPAFRKLGKPTVLALTATATDAVTADIRTQLGIAASGVINTGAYRANLHYRVEQVAREEDKLARVLALVAGAEGSGLVYTATVKAAEAVHAALVAAGASALIYHGKLPAADRHAAQEAFMDGRVRVMVATNAFGLGIDKPDIRFVLHYQMPAGLDAYYQESGRAGRDGLDADCTLLFLRSDKAVQQFFMGGRYPGEDDVRALYGALQGTPPDAQDGWSLAQLQHKLRRPLNKLRVATSLLRRQRIAAVDTGGHVYLLKKHLDDAGLLALMTAYRGKRELDQDALEGMVFYAQTGQCRWRVLLAHLQGREDAEDCGGCDNCRRIAEARAGLQAQLAERAVETVQTLATGPVFKPDDAVKVKRYGRGRVVAADASTVTVAFEEGPQRAFHPDYVSPVRPASARSRRNTTKL